MNDENDLQSQDDELARTESVGDITSPYQTSQRARSSSEVQITDQVHWQSSVILGNKQKAWWTKFVEESLPLQSFPGLAGIEEEHVSQALAWSGVDTGILNSIKRLSAKEAPMVTNGVFFEVRLAELPKADVMPSKASGKEGPNWEPCWHSTSLTNLPEILTNGIKTGPNALVDKKGTYRASVYTEESKRKHCSFMYSTHIAVPGLPPVWWFGVAIKCIGDQNRRRKQHSQFLYESGAVRVNTVYIHVRDIRLAYERQHVGFTRVLATQYYALSGISHADGPTPFLEDPRRYGKPQPSSTIPESEPSNASESTPMAMPATGSTASSGGSSIAPNEDVNRKTARRIEPDLEVPVQLCVVWQTLFLQVTHINFSYVCLVLLKHKLVFLW